MPLKKPLTFLPLSSLVRVFRLRFSHFSSSPPPDALAPASQTLFAALPSFSAVVVVAVVVVAPIFSVAPS